MNRMPIAITSLLNAATDVAILATDTHGLVTLYNQGVASLLGYNAEEVIGHYSLMDFHLVANLEDGSQETHLLTEVIQTAFEALRAQVKKGNSVKEEWTLVRKDGVALPVMLAVSPIYDEESLLQGFMVILTDMSGHRLAEAKTFESEQQLVQSQQIARIGSWEYTVKTRTLQVSPQFFRLLDITNQQEQQALARKATGILHYIHPEDMKYVKRVLRNAFFQQENFHIEHRICTRSGDVFYLRSIGCLLRNANGHVVKFQGTIQDITEQKLEERELIKARREAEQAMEVKQQFLSTISHEIRTPLNAVLGITHLLLQETPRDNQLEKLKMLLFSSENLLSLINDVLDYSKMDAGKTVFEEIVFDLNELLFNIKHSFGYTANNKDIKINTRLDSMLPNKVMGDPYRLAQVMNNLLSNAIKFTETGSITMEVMIASEDEKGMTLDFAVTDTGIGIPEDRLAFIFESFVQASSSTTRHFGGTGLGLAITKRLLELQGSRIYVNSTVGQGSRFFFSLTFKKCQSVAESAVPHEFGTEDMGHTNVLLVEDNDINRMIVTKLLNHLDIQPDWAMNGLEAVEKVQAKEYQLVLMDVQMPEMNGYEATLAIRALKDQRYQELPIVALTATDIPELMHKTGQVGITDFISKPFTPEALLRMVRKYTNGRAAAEPVFNQRPSQFGSGEENISRMEAPEPEQLTHTWAEWLQLLKKEYHLAVVTRDEMRLSAAIYTLESTFAAFDFSTLLLLLQQGRELILDRHTSQEQFFQSVNHVHVQCDAMIAQLGSNKRSLVLKTA